MVASDFLKSAPPPHPYTRSWRRKHPLSSAGHTPPSSPTRSTDCSYFSTDESSASQDKDLGSFKRSHQMIKEYSRRQGKFTNSESQDIPSAFSSLSIARSVFERERSEPLCRCDADMVERASQLFAEPTPPSSPENVHTSLEHSLMAVKVLRRSPRFKSSPPIKGASRRHNPSNSSGGPQYPTPPRTSNRDTIRYGKIRFSYLKPTQEEYKGLLYSGSENLIEFMTDYDLSIAKKSDLDVGKHILNLFGEVEMLDVCAEDLHVVKKRILSHAPTMDSEVRTDDGN